MQNNRVSNTQTQRVAKQPPENRVFADLLVFPELLNLLQRCRSVHQDTVTSLVGAEQRSEMGDLRLSTREGGKTLAFQPGANFLFIEDMDWKALHTQISSSGSQTC